MAQCFKCGKTELRIRKISQWKNGRGVDTQELLDKDGALHVCDPRDIANLNKKPEATLYHAKYPNIKFLMTLDYPDKPKEQFGLRKMCQCNDSDIQPTCLEKPIFDWPKMKTVINVEYYYWCARCGLDLPMTAIGKYFVQTVRR